MEASELLTTKQADEVITELSPNLIEVRIKANLETSRPDFFADANVE